ncbi:MAG: glycosyltransferase family 4 protein [Terriglobales bacterium]
MKRILYVAFPIVAVTASVAGGAEQMLWTLEQEMAERRRRTTVAACAGSEVAGKLLVTGSEPETTDAFEERRAEHERAVLSEIRRASENGSPFDLVHDESGHFWRHARDLDVPVLATLHLPRSFYPAAAFESVPPNVFFNCVSESQLATFSDVPQVLGAIGNGIRIADFPPPSSQRDDYLLWVGRICEEKGAHVAIEVAERAGLPLVIAGRVHAYSYHQDYYQREIAPRIDGRGVRFVDSPSFWEKLKLLRHARTVLVPSLVEETSSLVAMEAGACGTPVIGFRRGAIPEIVQEGVTGFVVNSAEEMIDAIPRTGEIDPEDSRDHIKRNFSAARMADDYERMYERILGTAAAKERAAA